MVKMISILTPPTISSKALVPAAVIESIAESTVTMDIGKLRRNLTGGSKKLHSKIFVDTAPLMAVGQSTVEATPEEVMVVEPPGNRMPMKFNKVRYTTKARLFLPSSI